MAGEWRELPFSKLCDITRGASPRPIHEWISDAGIPWVKISDANAAQSRFITHTNEHIRSEGRHRSVEVHPGDLILSNSATPGIPKFMGIDACIHDGWLLLRNLRNLDKAFAYYLLLHERPRLVEQGNGSVFTNLKTDILKNHRVQLPPLPEQRAIAHILGTLDDKIELNRKQNETLEAMARALFKAWFVDFEPVRAKIEGRARQDGARSGQPRTPQASDLPWPGAEAGAGAEGWQRGQSLPGLPAHLYDLFPDRLVESEMGEIPEGWEVRPAGDIFDIGIGKTPPRKEPHWFSINPNDIPWMSIKDLGQAGVFVSDVSEYLTAAAVERFRVKKIPDSTVVLSFKLTVGRVSITDGEMLSNEAIAHFVPRRATFLSPAYLYCYLRQFDYGSLGSTSSIATAVNSDSVRSIPILAPSAKLHEAFLDAVWPFFLTLRGIQRQSRTLAKLRDTLLPKLISGALRVKDAEGFLEART